MRINTSSVRTGAIGALFLLLAGGFMLPSKPTHAFESFLQFPQPIPESGVYGRMSVLPAATEAVNAGAQKFINDMGSRAIGFLGNAGMTQEQKVASFRKLLQESFDMETLGRFAVGRYWRTATPAQQKEFLKLFREMIVSVYSTRFEDYKGQSFEARSFRADGEKDTIVTSYIIPDGGPEVQVDWRVRYKDGRYKVVDVVVEGVSMSVTQRSDFAAVIQSGGGDIQVLLDHLNKKS